MNGAPHTSFADLVNNERPPVGTFVKLHSIEIIEILKLAGFDFFVIDFEHAMLSLADVNAMIALAVALDFPALVRVADHHYADVQKILDAGAMGLFFPHVSNGEQCQQVIRQAVHPPSGSRGAGGGMRAAEWGVTPNGRANYAANGLERVTRVPMIEEAIAIEHIDEILKVPGVGALFLGPADLSMTMEKSVTDPEVQTAIRTVFDAAKREHIPIGTVAGDLRGAQQLVETGYDFIMVSNDIAMFGNAARGFIEGLK